jgi:hypothetical protein
LYALKGPLAGRTFEPADELVEEICEMTSNIPRAKLETVFSNEKRDCNSSLTLMAPMSTQLQHDLIDSFRSLLEVLMPRTYRTLYKPPNGPDGMFFTLKNSLFHFLLQDPK